MWGHVSCNRRKGRRELHRYVSRGKGKRKGTRVGTGSPVGLRKSESGESSKRPAEALAAIVRTLVSS